MYPTQLTGAERQAVAIAHFFVLLLLLRNEVKERFENYWNDEKIRLNEKKREVIRIRSSNCPLTYL